MKLGELAERIGATIGPGGRNTSSAEVERIYAGDVISDLLREASEVTLLVTSLVSPQLLRVAELMDVPGICFVDGRLPEPAVVAAAAESGIVLLVSPAGLAETRGRLDACFPDAT
jgi:hypothetical protein